MLKKHLKCAEYTPFRLICIVTAAHLLAILLLTLSWAEKPQHVKNERMFIQTVSLKKSVPVQSVTLPLPPSESAKTASSSKNREVPSPNPVPLEKLEAKDKPAPPPAKKVIKPSKPQEKKSLQPPAKKNIEDSSTKEMVRKKQQILKEAQESLSQINQPSAKSKHLQMPEAIGTLQIETDSKTFGNANLKSELSYRNELAQVLQDYLKLQEFGNVKLELTIQRDGSLVSMKVLSAESVKNQHYLEEKLKTFRFPPFGSSFEKETKKTFIISIKNKT